MRDDGRVGISMGGIMVYERGVLESCMGSVGVIGRKEVRGIVRDKTYKTHMTCMT